MELLSVGQRNSGRTTDDLAVRVDDQETESKDHNNDAAFREVQEEARIKSPHGGDNDQDLSDENAENLAVPERRGDRLSGVGEPIDSFTAETVAGSRHTQPADIVHKHGAWPGEKRTHLHVQSATNEIGMRADLDDRGNKRAEFQKTGVAESQKGISSGDFRIFQENRSLRIASSDVGTMVTTAHGELDDVDIKNMLQIEVQTEKGSPQGTHAVRPVSAGTPLAPPSLAAQVATSLTRADGTDEIEIRLDPPDLGKVKISFVTTGGDAIRAVLTAEHGQILDHLRKHAEELTHALEKAGFEQIDLQFKENDGDQSAFDSHTEISVDTQMTDDTVPETAVTYLQINEGTSMDVRV